MTHCNVTNVQELETLSLIENLKLILLQLLCLTNNKFINSFKYVSNK